jgi:hypothetical protein
MPEKNLKKRFTFTISWIDCKKQRISLTEKEKAKNDRPSHFEFFHIEVRNNTVRISLYAQAEYQSGSEK